MQEPKPVVPASTENVRPSKKQRELLTFIEEFIEEHGYSPSYREIMAGCGYTSVATVALHVNSLISRGHIRKRDRSARSLEVVNPADQQHAKPSTNQVAPNEEKWLVEKVEHFMKQAEQAGQNTETAVANLHVLVNALRVLGLDGAAQSYTSRLTAIRETVVTDSAIDTAS